MEPNRSGCAPIYEKAEYLHGPLSTESARWARLVTSHLLTFAMQALVMRPPDAHAAGDAELAAGNHSNEPQ